MRSGTVRGLVEAKKLEAGENREELNRLVKAELDSLFEEGKIKPDEFSVKGLFEELVVSENPDITSTSSAERIAEAVTTTAFPTITSSVIHNTIIPAYELEVGDLASLCREAPATKTANDKVAGFTTGGGPERRLETMAYQETDFGEKYIEIDLSDFGRIISLTREAIYDDRTGQLLDRARDIGEKGGQHRALMIAETIEVAPRTAFGESASRAFVYKGTALTASQFYSSDHSSVADKQTNDNVDTTALSFTGIDALNTLFQGMVDENGDRIIIRPKTLLVPPALWTTATKLMFGATDPDQVGAQVNPFKGMYDLKQSPYLSSSTKYYLGDFQKQLLWLWVWKPETAVQTANSEVAFSSQIIQRYRFDYNGGVGHTDYRHICRGGT